MYVYSPNPSRKAPITLIAICLCAGVMLFWPISENKTVDMLLKAFGLWAFFGSFVLAYKFIWTSYTYTLEKNNGSVDLTVDCIFIKRKRTVCRISVSDIENIKLKLKGKKAEPTDKKVPVYKYFACLLCRSYCILELSEKEDNAIILLTPDEKMLNLIKTNKSSS